MKDKQVMNVLKAIARQFIKDDDWTFMKWCRSRFGLKSAIFTYVHLLFNRDVGRVPFGQKTGHLFLRPGTADQKLYDQIFVENEYDLDLADPSFIVDAGAYIGLSSIYFACKYPNATVVAIEPEESNFSVLLKNTKKYPKIKPERAGLWSRTSLLVIQDTAV